MDRPSVERIGLPARQRRAKLFSHDFSQVMEDMACQGGEIIMQV